jgi:beta-xylosidase
MSMKSAQLALGLLRRPPGLAVTLLLVAGAAVAGPHGTYRNPVLFGDYSDPDVVRAEDGFYLVSSSFGVAPGLPVLFSPDLVSWTIVGHALPRLPSPTYDTPQHGKGVWAPSIRFHAGRYWIYYGDPDLGIFMTSAVHPRGPWDPLVRVAEARGWIDPCPFWDDDGSAWLVHAWAKSRAGFNGVLTLRRLAPDGRSLLDEGRTVFEGREAHPTIEGPKLYKRNGYYYIFAPAGGVRTGWQTVLRARDVQGPYEARIVLEQGRSAVNGPHQGAWVETASGESWFVHFQDRGAYGRIVHLQPMTWRDDWPVIGEDRDADGRGEPVAEWPKPSGASSPAATPQASDDFDGPGLGLQWQWPANPSREWWSLDARPGSLRLAAVPAAAEGVNLWNAGHLLLQKLPAAAFTASARIDAAGLLPGERAGLVVMGLDHAGLSVRRTGGGLLVAQTTSRDADRGGAELDLETRSVEDPRLELRVTVAPGAVCRFSFSRDGRSFTTIGKPFVARPGLWTGAKVGVFAQGPAGALARGHADFEWFRAEPSRTSAGVEGADLVVASDGSGDFRAVQEALDAIPRDNDDWRTVLVRKGTYREKLSITRGRVALVGEDRSGTRIEFAELRRNWRKSHPDDWGAAVVNIGPEATDVVLGNLTVRNDYGDAADDHDHQFAIRSMGDATRIALLHVDAVAEGGDTVSLWNSASGLSYYAGCYFEGWVDYFCPRGSAYVTDSRFYGRSPVASIWHDGSKDRGQKLVIRRSRFDGVPGFALGRNHRDGQFYLLDASFSSSMADRPIYPASPPESYAWGPRYYYAGCHRDGGDLDWFRDNLGSAEGAPREEDLTPAWTFGGRWDPEETLPPLLPFAALPRPGNGSRFVEAEGVTLRWTAGRNAISQRLHFGTGRPPGLVAEPEATAWPSGRLEPATTYFWRVDTVTGAGVVPGAEWSFTTRGGRR